ncbi:MAG: hypothetical protein GOMPHAMPRED_003174 [Gomphillus americanus]|uniref:Nucleolar complex-associated protein 3 n=1 Tax=Gomphillus americanus TaxID=1940652 RepID=A0A8H3I5F2_9LECA|nr:MAG: hypothetical protein GOMPHAMPRED_003174 [Gomphillus americanus]
MAVEPPVKRRRLSPISLEAADRHAVLGKVEHAEDKEFTPRRIPERNYTRRNEERNGISWNDVQRYGTTRRQTAKKLKESSSQRGRDQKPGKENGHHWGDEQDYEKQGRTLEKEQKESTRLPIKTGQGILQHLESTNNKADIQDDAGSWLDSSDAQSASGQSDDDTQDEGKPQVPHKQQVMAAKEELARLALLLNQDPEENSSAFKALSEMGNTDNVTIKKLALATQMTVFKDVIPGYRIRPLTEKDMSEKVSREVKKKRAAEQALVRYYQRYVNELSSCAKKGKEGTGLDVIAISCTCNLLLAVPHFNSRSELLQIVVNKLSHRKAEDDQSRKCIGALEQMFLNDEDGNASLDAVRMIVQMMKARKWNVEESVLNTFLHLRLLSEFNSKASTNAVDKPIEADGKKLKQKREFRTKRHRKHLKEIKAAEKDFQEADAIVSHEERDKKQAETLKIVFATYFKILKAQVRHLTGAVLEGLAKFAHLINQDFFGDLLEVFRELAYNAAARFDAENALETTKSSNFSKDPARTALLCANTAFALLSAQDASRLSLDLSSFTSLLYSLLIPHLALHPDLELSHKTLRLSDPHSSTPELLSAPKINVSTTSTLLIRALTAALLPRTTPHTRLAAFTHRILMTALHTPEKSSRALITLLSELARSQGKKIRPLWYSEERRGDGEFDPMADIDACRAYAGSVWEGELLRYHYATGVGQAIGGLESVVADLAS